MGRMGESTGYPALRHQVFSTQEIEKAAKHDLIIIGSGNNLSVMTQWKDYLPLAMADGERTLREPRTSWRSIYRWAEKEIPVLIRWKMIIGLPPQALWRLSLRCKQPGVSAFSMPTNPVI